MIRSFRYIHLIIPSRIKLDFWHFFQQEISKNHFKDIMLLHQETLKVADLRKQWCHLAKRKGSALTNSTDADLIAQERMPKQRSAPIDLTSDDIESQDSREHAAQVSHFEIKIFHRVLCSLIILIRIC
jgi:hypothetical protein